MVLGEAISIDPGVVVLILAVLLLVLLAAAAVVVAGVVAGYRSGRDAGRTSAAALWTGCLLFESLALVLAAASTEVVWILPAALAVLATAGARWLGRRRRR